MRCCGRAAKDQAKPLNDSAEKRFRQTSAPANSEALYRLLVESFTDCAVFAVSPDGVILTWNAGAMRAFGYCADEIIGRHAGIIFTAEDLLRAEPARELAAALTGAPAGFDRWYVRRDGSRFWGSATVAPMFDAAGNLQGFAKLLRDATAGHAALAALRDSEQRLRLLVESVHEYAIFATDLEGNITSWNSGAERTFGYTHTEILGKNIAQFSEPADVAAGVVRANLAQAARRGSCHDERWLVRKNGTRFSCSGRLTQLKRAEGGELRGFVMVAHDITERTLAAEELRRRACFDALTQLPNRTTFFEHVGRAIASMKRRPTDRFAVLFIDLDHFKTINDTVGHVVADRVLTCTARRLERCVRAEDVAARLSGDEFAILLNGIGGLADANDAVDRIRIEMSKPVWIDGNAVDVTASIGIALGNACHNTPDEIVHDADTAMYAAKARGRARSGVFGD